jgi:hypothetical protein
MFKSADNIFIWRFIVLLLVILFLINLVKANKFEKFEKFNNWYNNGISSITESSSAETIMCAKSCCYSGWPASISIDETALGVKPEDMGVKYRATNLKCNNGFTTGCVCNAI